MIVPVKKIRLLTAQSERETLIKALQHENRFMLFDHKEEVSLPSDSNHELNRISRGIEVLSSNEKKKFFHFHEVDRESFERIADEAREILRIIDIHLQQIEIKKQENVKLDEDIQSLNPYLNLGVATKELDILEKTKIVIGSVSLVNFEEFSKESTEKGHVFEESSRDQEFVYGAFGYELVFENEALKLLNAFRFNEASLPKFDTKLKELLPELTKKVKDNNKIISESNAELKKLSAKSSVLKTYYDYFYNDALRRQVEVKTTERVIYLEGWVREDEFDAFRQSLDKKLEYDIEELAINEEEMVPTATKNNKFVTQFESITNMFSVPHPKEIDPNPAMAVWYWVIFGIMMGDIGYGLAMLIVFLLYLKLKKPKGALKTLAIIFVLSSIPSIIFGVLTGSFFGVTFDLLKVVGGWFGRSDLSAIVLQPVDDPLPMLIFSLGLGVLHILTALVLKIVNEVRRKDILSALADGLSWILILIGIIVVVLGMMTPVTILSTIGFVVIGVGALLILFLNGRNNKGIIGKAFGGLGGLYNVTGYLSDVLSYSRILALSLSTAVIAMTMNLLAGMVMGVPFIGIILALIVYLVGHIFNFAMGLLSAYVHDGRLQYLEFFGKFYEGGGYEFTPLTYKFKYIDEIKEKSL